MTKIAPTRKHTSPSKSAAALLAKADAYARAANRARSSVSLYLFNDGKTLDALANGGDIMTRALEKAHAELDRRMEALKHTPAPAPRKSVRGKPKGPQIVAAIRRQASAAAMASAKRSPRKTAITKG